LAEFCCTSGVPLALALLRTAPEIESPPRSAWSAGSVPAPWQHWHQRALQPLKQPAHGVALAFCR
jgi:hypothetical protein